MFNEQWFGHASQMALRDLYRLTVHLDGNVVEVGSWQGRSTVALAAAAYPCRVHAVDTWNGSPGEISADLAAGRDVYAEFTANIARLTAGNVDPYRMGWDRYFANYANATRFLFIDAEHSYEAVAGNIDAALPYLVPGAVICGDDLHHDPVRQAVLERFPDAMTAATLWWATIGGDE